MQVRVARVVRRAQPDGAPAKSVVVEVSGARISLERGFDTELLGAVRALGGAR